ncbi:hypothetical protein MUK42_18030 [Musa troglodytarum]|uniref:Uncharacterized protein n=1 Tax=Musa troglodytarum TaxID=320322 RepID=A0A9E7HPY7_9LILI|nr:hypothetical protein MUK42_18030 [Musa troglodytarum]
MILVSHGVKMWWCSSSNSRFFLCVMTILNLIHQGQLADSGKREFICTPVICGDQSHLVVISCYNDVRDSSGKKWSDFASSICFIDYTCAFQSLPP